MKKLALLVFLFCSGISYGQVVANTPSPIILCDDTNPGDEIEVFDLTSREAEIINGQDNVTVSYHLTSGDALGNGGFIMNPENYTNSSNPQQIFIRVQGSNNFDITTMDIEVVQYAVAASLPENIFIDEGDTNGQAIFDLTENETEMLGGQFAVDFVFTYYLSAADCDAQTNPLPNPSAYENTVNPQDIYVRMEPFNAPCGTCYNFEISSDGILGFETTKLDSLKLFPNPAQDFITLNSNDLASAEIIISDVQGRVIIRLEGNNNMQRINISALDKGMYFVAIQKDNLRVASSFLKR